VKGKQGERQTFFLLMRPGGVQRRGRSGHMSTGEGQRVVEGVGGESGQRQV